jgi:hypothetical protein
VLRDPAGLTSGDVRAPDAVEDGGLSVVDVAHDRHHRGSNDQLGFVDVLFLDPRGGGQLLLGGIDDRDGDPELLRDELHRFVTH